MKTRREAIKLLALAAAGASAFFSRLFAGVQDAAASVKRRLLPKDTDLENLVDKNPADLDASRLEVTPLEEFGTMGRTNYSISRDHWRLEITGTVERPLNITYDQLVGREAVERDVLLICPGFFAYKGSWRGVSAYRLLQEAGIAPGSKAVLFSGPGGSRGKTERFSLEEVRSDKVFLAYQVNGRPLPQKHGFPLRVVAEDHYGARWVKYVDEITVI